MAVCFNSCSKKFSSRRKSPRSLITWRSKPHAFTGLKLPPGIKQQSYSSQPDAVRTAVGLDSGEAAALSLAVEIHADTVLIDERRGYEVAVQLGLRTIGILGILFRARSAGFLPAVKPALDALQRDAGFWLSEPLRKQVLQAAGET
jgi:predicted nucleic acid-binding protein